MAETLLLIFGENAIFSKKRIDILNAYKVFFLMCIILASERLFVVYVINIP